jgi:phosphatidylglycerol:prolipoprotein diacylglycerol transferase
MVTIWAVQGTDITRDQVYSTALWAVPGGIIGSRLLFVLEKWSYFQSHPLEILAFQEGGLTIYGALIGGSLSGALYAKFSGIKVGRLADRAAYGMVLGQAIGRIGDIINGEHLAIPTDLPWAVVYSHPNTMGERGLAVHPAVGYELLMDLSILGLLWLTRGRWPREGMAFFFYASLYSLGRFFVSFLRKDVIIALGLRQAQWVAILVLAIAIAMIVYLLSQKRQVAMGETD